MMLKKVKMLKLWMVHYKKQPDDLFIRQCFIGLHLKISKRTVRRK